MKTILISMAAMIGTPAITQNPPHVVVIRPYAPPAASPVASTSAAAQKAPPVQEASTTALAQVTPTPASLAKGHQLAATLNSDEVTKIQFDKMFSKTMPDAMRQVPTYQVLEKQYPGIIMAIVDGSRPIIEAETRKEAPQLIDRLGTLYASYMTDDELGNALDFYGSPTGKWVIETVATNSDATAVMQKAIDDPDAKMVPDDVTKSTINPALPTLVAGMTPDRLKATSAFVATSAGRKIKALQPQVNQISADWANAMKADAGPAVGTAMIGIAQKYIAAHGGAEKPAAGS